MHRLFFAFIAGALAVLLFHQPVLWLLHAAQLTAAVPYGLRPTRPFGVPQLWSLAFWGGIWGVVVVAIAALFRHRWLAAALIGAVGPSLVAWFVVMPLKGQSAGGGWAVSAIATALLVNAAWGFGTLVLFDVFTSSARTRVPI